MQPSKHEHTHWTCFYYVRKIFALRFACCSVFCRCFAVVLQVIFAVSRPTILKPQSQCTLPARTGGHLGHSPPPVQTFIPLCSPVSLPIASGCLDRGPPGPLNAPCPGFAPYLSVAQIQLRDKLNAPCPDFPSHLPTGSMTQRKHDAQMS